MRYQGIRHAKVMTAVGLAMAVTVAGATAAHADSPQKIDRSAADATTLSRTSSIDPGQRADYADTLRRFARGDAAAPTTTPPPRVTAPKPAQASAPVARRAAVSAPSVTLASVVEPLLAPATVPTITAPTNGAAIGGTVAVSATSSASSVRFALVVAGVERASVETPVAAGTASDTLPTFGVSGAAQIVAVDCAGACAVDGDVVAVTVDNPAPVLTAPAWWQVVKGSTFTASATAGGGAVRFIVDGAIGATDTDAPYSSVIDASGLAAGEHKVWAIQCNADASACDWAKPSEKRSILVTVLRPKVLGVSPATFSPNGDGRYDSTRIDYRLDRASKVQIRVRNTYGSTVFGPRTIATNASAGTHAYRWSGRGNSGSNASSGTYAIELTTSASVGGQPGSGTAGAQVRVDNSKPRLSGLGATASTFYPVQDGYKDTTRVVASPSESLRWAKANFYNSSGSLVRSLSLTSPSGQLGFTWNGRSSSGSIVRPGTYTYAVSAEDRVGNRTTTGRKSLYLSTKRLSARSGTKTVTPYNSYSTGLIGTCSAVVYPARSEWPGSLGYYSDYDFCAYYDEDYLAAAIHKVTLPSAIKYGSVKVSAYGGSATYLAETGALFYLDRNQDVTDYGRGLGANDGWYSAPSAPASTVLDGRTFRWVAGTTDSNWYDIRYFKVTWTYYVLA